MEYHTITADTYEKALQEAQKRYGDAVRVHSRREYSTGGGLFTKRRKRCEITFYLSATPARKVAEEGKDAVSKQDLAEFEKEAQTPDPEALSAAERLDTLLPGKELEAQQRVSSQLEAAASMLDDNNITLSLRDAVLKDFSADGGDVALALCDRIISEVKIDHENQAHPKKYQVFLGPTGSGKTTTLAKVAALYQRVGRSVAVITLDSYRVGAYEQVKAFADAFSMPCILVKDEDEVLTAQDKLASYDLVMVDTMGVSPADVPLNLKLRGLLSLFPERDTSFLLVSPAVMKCEDMLIQLKHYNSFRKITSLIVTKLDESGSIGAFLSFAHESGAPIAFCTAGQEVPDDIEKASTLTIMEHLRNLGHSFSGQIGQLS